MKPEGNNLKNILDDHKNWLLSQGQTGKLADLNGWNLDNANLEMTDLTFAKIHHASLKNANLWGASLSRAELNGADFEGADISSVDLSLAQCEGVNFADANLEDAKLDGVNLRKANFKGAILRGASFIGAMLGGVSFTGADLLFSKMVEANIEGADFEGANIEATNFEGTNISAANFEKTTHRVHNVKKHLSQSNFKDNTNSNPILNKTKSFESGEKNYKSDKVTLNRRSSIKSSREDLFVDLTAVKPDTIEKAIGDLIDKVKSNVQLDQVKTLCKHQHGIEKIDKIDITQADIVTHNGQIAFKLDFKISYNLSLILDRKGNLINKPDLKA